MTRRWLRPGGIAAGLVAVLGANYYLRSTLEDAPEYLYSFLEKFYPDQVPVIFEQMPKWRWLLPLPELTGAWAASTLLLTHLLELSLTPAGVWYLYNAIVIVVSFVCSFALFRSAVFSFTFAIAMGFGTHFYHAYAVTGGIASYIFAAYYVLLLFTTVQVVRGLEPRWAWRAAFAISLVLNMLGYEGWLDTLVLVWVSTPFVYVLLRRMDRLREASRFIRLSGVFTVAGVSYVLVKVTVGYGQTGGSESDIWLNYSSVWLMADDFIANIFLHPYLAVSTFVPPMFAGANALFRLGAGPVLDSQHGYHGDYLYLVAMHQIFFWRFYAGALLVLLIVAIRAAALRMWRQPSAWTLALLVFLLMVLVPGSTHSMVKFRAMNAMPTMAYHVTVGATGVSLLLAWWVTNVWRNSSRPAVRVGAAAMVWLAVLYAALARPAYLTHMSAQVGLGEFLYPNPMRSLLEKLGGTYDAPAGMAEYRLRPVDRDEGVRNVRNLLAELPNPLPRPVLWTKTSEAFVMTEAPDGVIELEGDATQYGYQLESPLIALRPGESYLVRLRYEVLAGRVCAGILSGDRSRWVVAPDGTTPELAFDAGTMAAVTVVLANCHPYDLSNPRTRLKLLGGSYSSLPRESAAASR